MIFIGISWALIMVSVCLLAFEVYCEQKLDDELELKDWVDKVFWFCLVLGMFLRWVAWTKGH